MAGAFDAKLEELGITLPDAAAPAANYVPYVLAGDLLHVSGQLPKAEDGTLITGTLGAGLTIEDGQRAAELCAIHLLAQVKAACDGDLDRLVRIVKLGAFVNSTPEFIDQPQVVNGASNLLVEILGDTGQHARSAVASPSLPFGVAVEIDGVFQIK
ncbi:MAG: RidA family protein [Pseudomonadota bacterium]